jgi:hypothetical protein
MKYERMKRYMYTTHVNGYSIIYIYILYSYIFNIYQVPHVIPKFLRVRKVRKKGTNLGYVSMSSKSGRFRKKRSRIIILSCSLENLSGNILTSIPTPYHQPATIFQLHRDMGALSHPRALRVCACAVPWLLPGAQQLSHIRLNFMSAT